MTSFDPRQSKQPEGNNGLLLAVFVAVAAMMGWEYFNPPVAPAASPVAVSSTPSIAGVLPGSPEMQISNDVHDLAATPSASSVERIALSNNVLTGGVALTGGRIDELLLSRYDIELKGEDRVSMFSSSGKRIHFFDAGWQSTAVPVPNGNTPWQAQGSSLTASSPLVLKWNNDRGQEFLRTFSLQNDAYTVRVVDEVINRSDEDVQIGHYAQIHKADGLEKGGEGYTAEQSTFYNFIGPEALIDGVKYESNYDDIKTDKKIKYTGEKGWLGIKSRYFLAALIPDQQSENTWQFKYSNVAGRDFYSVIVQTPQASRVAANGGIYTKSYSLYIGPNKRNEMAKESVGLEESVDYGWYQVISLPLYSMLMYFGNMFGNLGVAIILSTVVLKVLLLPLANKSYRSMARMKLITPEMEALKERLGDNREQMGLEMMKLYKKHKVNPASGCWPMLVQIPIFFAFYKVILISFEFRHAPFVGWIHDLSANDPFFVLPVLMGVSMFFQQKLNPPVADPIQRKVMSALPVIFTVMFAMFPAGLVLYWVVNNVLSIAQQWYIMRRLEAQTSTTPKGKK
tara:strand:+ start:265503 stop:267206 length:1704 start_codon:yes stop_codon:yes gene_type:complete